MLSKIILTSLALMAMFSLGTAAPDPQYQKPTVANPVLETAASNHCGDSSFTCTYGAPILDKTLCFPRTPSQTPVRGGC